MIPDRDRSHKIIIIYVRLRECHNKITQPILRTQRKRKPLRTSLSQDRHHKTQVGPTVAVEDDEAACATGADSAMGGEDRRSA